jgi:transcription initiation factor TFIIIB Brf1 subunit/transcription initiation factor TFIIB
MNCPKCSGEAVSPEGQNGERVCSKCGLVLNGESVAHGIEFTHYTPEWYSTWGEQDSETLREWLTALRTVSCQLNVPNFPYREEAARTIRKGNHLLFKSQNFGKNKRATVAALVHLILREYGKDRSLKEIAQQLSLDSRLVMKQAWTLSKTINQEKQVIKIERKSSKDYLFECGGKVIADKTTLKEAEETLIKLPRIGGNPIAIAAGALYYICRNKKYKVSKDQIGEAFGISHRTVYTNEARIRNFLQRHKAIKAVIFQDKRQVVMVQNQRFASQAIY